MEAAVLPKSKICDREIWEKPKKSLQIVFSEYIFGS